MNRYMITLIVLLLCSLQGFETRGTEISQRTVAWDNLMEESRPSGSLIIDPSELITKVRINIQN